MTQQKVGVLQILNAAAQQAYTNFHNHIATNFFPRTMHWIRLQLRQIAHFSRLPARGVTSWVKIYLRLQAQKDARSSHTSLTTGGAVSPAASASAEDGPYHPPRSITANFTHSMVRCRLMWSVSVCSCSTLSMHSHHLHRHHHYQLQTIGSVSGSSRQAESG